MTRSGLIRRRWDGAFALATALLALACGAAPTAAPAGQRHGELFAHGTGDGLWVAESFWSPDNPEDQTTEVSARPLQGEWKQLVEFPARVVTLADQNGELIAVLADGDWKRIAPGSFTSGPALPGRGLILAMAAEGNAIWAVGYGEPPPPASGPGSSTRPAPRPATVAGTVPTLATRPARLQLFSLAGTRWLWHAELPEAVQVAPDPHAIGLVVRAGRPTLAAADDPGAVRLFGFNPAERRWAITVPPAPAFAVRELKLLKLRERLVLWASDGKEPGALLYEQLDGSWSAPQPIQLQGPGAKGVTALTVAGAGDEVRVIAAAGHKRLEQKYDAAGRLTAPLTELPAVAANGSGGAMDWTNLVVLAALSLVLMATATRRHGGVVPVGTTQLALAPLGPRLAAGVIDLLPVVGTVVVLQMLARRRALEHEVIDPRWVWALWGSVALYIAHTMSAELAWGRTFGKMFVGLRVVTLDGLPAPRRAIVLRNLLRLVDVFALVLPLAMIFFSPLRQRLGDVVAGTLVVGKRPPEPAERPDTRSPDGDDDA